MAKTTLEDILRMMRDGVSKPEPQKKKKDKNPVVKKTTAKKITKSAVQKHTAAGMPKTEQTPTPKTEMRLSFDFQSLMPEENQARLKKIFETAYDFPEQTIETCKKLFQAIREPTVELTVKTQILRQLGILAHGYKANNPNVSENIVAGLKAINDDQSVSLALRISAQLGLSIVSCENLEQINRLVQNDLFPSESPQSPQA